MTGTVWVTRMMVNSLVNVMKGSVQTSKAWWWRPYFVWGAWGQTARSASTSNFLGGLSYFFEWFFLSISALTSPNSQPSEPSTSSAPISKCLLASFNFRPSNFVSDCFVYVQFHSVLRNVFNDIYKTFHIRQNEKLHRYSSLKLQWKITLLSNSIFKFIVSRWFHFQESV